MPEMNVLKLGFSVKIDEKDGRKEKNEGYLRFAVAL